jgi:predicted metal-dependent peptidase
MDIQNDLTVTCKNLMFTEPFYGLLLLNLQKEFTTKIETAGVGLNGINYKLLINPEFWKELTPEKKTGLLKHELMHIAFFHVTEYTHLKDQKIANVAMDIEINQKINENELPVGGCTLDKFEHLGLLRDEGTNNYYKKLMQKKEENDSTMQQLMEAFQQQGDGKPDPNGTPGDKPGDTPMLNGQPIDLPKHEWDDFKDMPETQKKLIDQQLAKVISDVAVEVTKNRGTIPREVSIFLEKILSKEPPKFNWKAYLRRYIGNSIKTSVRKTKRKVSKRFELDFGLKIQEHSHILIGIDSSASVSDKEIYEFLGEIKHMYKTGHDFTLIFADTQMQDPIKYKPNVKLEIKKRGGTDFNPVVDYYHQHRNRFSTLIYLTDGEAPLPDNPVKNMLWVLSTISGDADHLKESGKVIKLN